MYTCIFIDTFAEAWRACQSDPIRTFQVCSLTLTGACNGRRRRRVRRSHARSRSRRRHAARGIVGRSADPGDGPAGPSPNIASLRRSS
jgi:hypothetical protein